MDLSLDKKQNLMKLSTYITVIGVSLIILIKTFGFFATNSVTILASLIDSLLDVCVSIMNLLAVHYSIMPADRDHRFGHSKVEDIAVFCQAVFFILSGIFLIYISTEKFFSGSVANDNNLGIEIMVWSMLLTLAIVAFQYYVVKKTKSQVIEVDSLHYFSDFLSNFSAIIGIAIVTYWNMPIFDNITAVLIAIYIIYNATKLFRRSFNNLMDHELNDEEKQIIIDVLKSHKIVKGFHDLKTRYAGTKPFIQVHLELDPNMTIKQAHVVSCEIEQSILKNFPNAEVIIHQDPEGIEETVTYLD